MRLHSNACSTVHSTKRALKKGFPKLKQERSPEMREAFKVRDADCSAVRTRARPAGVGTRGQPAPRGPSPRALSGHCAFTQGSRARGGARRLGGPFLPGASSLSARHRQVPDLDPRPVAQRRVHGATAFSGQNLVRDAAPSEAGSVGEAGPRGTWARETL